MKNKVVWRTKRFQDESEGITLKDVCGLLATTSFYKPDTVYRYDEVTSKHP